MAIKLIALALLFLCINILAQEDSKVICTIKVNKYKFLLGELPKIEISIINNSKKDIYLLPALNGSEAKYRMPYCYFEIIKPTPDNLPLLSCKTTNPLLVSNFVLVKKGGIFNPFFGITSHQLSQADNFKQKGKYKIKFYYETSSSNILEYLGAEKWKANYDTSVFKNPFKKLAKIALVSNEIEIEVE